MSDSAAPTRSSRRRGTAVLCVALAATVTTITACQPQPVPTPPVGPKASSPPAEVNPHRCDRRVVVLGDSRVAEQGAVIPKTTDAVVARVLGVKGQRAADGSRDHVEVFAAPGTVHAQHVEELSAFTATCSAKERPLVIDVMGTNYLYEWAPRMGDPAVWSDIAAEVDDFYDDAAAPRALVALQELHLATALVADEDRPTVQAFVDGYNTKVLRALASAHPERYLFVPRPTVVVDGAVAFRDVLHPTSSSLLGFYEGGLTVSDLDGARALDAAATTAIGRANSACAVLALPAFAPEVNSQTRLLIAQLAATSPSTNPKAAAWLKAAARSPYRLQLTRTTETCRTELGAPTGAARNAPA